jgi:1-acyl-sn-glycerol-3-phosphate acyltransferase
VLRFIKNIGYIFYKVWFYVVSALPVLVFSPLLLIGVSSTRTYPLVYWCARSIWAPFILLMMGTPIRKVFGSEKLPDTPAIMIMNHTSMLDIMLMLRICKKPVVFVGKAELQRIWIFGFFYKRAVIMVDRSNKESRKKVYLSVQERVNNDASIAIYPEGGVPDSSVLIDRFKNGAFSMSLTHDLPIVPIINYDCKKRINWDLYHGGPGVLRYKIMPAIKAGTYTKDELEQFRDEVRNLFIKELTNEPPMN